MAQRFLVAVAPVFVDEYTPAGALVQSIAMPTTASGGSLALVAQGSANSEGFLTLSADAQYLSLAGYNSTIGTSSPSGGAAGTPVRTIGRITVGTGVIDTTIGVSDVSGTARGSYTPNGTDVFYSASSCGYRATTTGTNGMTFPLQTSPAAM